MITWICKPFNILTTIELYKILQLRSEVFVVEQKCPYLDCDEKDQASFHFGAWENDKLLAYVRILPPDLVYTEPSIGRVCTSPSARSSGLGKELMKKSIEQTYNLFGQHPIRIGAQLYLLNFYQSFGFKQEGETYLEDFIEHIQMVKNI